MIARAFYWNALIFNALILACAGHSLMSYEMEVATAICVGASVGGAFNGVIRLQGWIE